MQKSAAVVLLRTFYSQGTYLIKVAAIQVSVDSEQSSGYGLDDISEITRERHAYIPLISDHPPVMTIYLRTNLVREDSLVVQKALRPVHERIDIIRSRKFGRPLVLNAILPEVLKSAFW